MNKRERQIIALRDELNSRRVMLEAFQKNIPGGVRFLNNNLNKALAHLANLDHSLYRYTDNETTIEEHREYLAREYADFREAVRKFGEDLGAWTGLDRLP